MPRYFLIGAKTRRHFDLEMPVMLFADGWMGEGWFFCTISLGSTVRLTNHLSVDGKWAGIDEEVNPLKWNPLYYRIWLNVRMILLHVANTCPFYLFFKCQSKVVKKNIFDIGNFCDFFILKNPQFLSNKQRKWETLVGLNSKLIKLLFSWRV